MVDRQVTNINSVTINSNPATNILDVDYQFVMQDKVRHTPNVVEGLGIRNYPKYHRIIIVHDSITDIYDSYIDDDGKNPVIPSGSIEYAVLNAGVAEVATWTLQANKWYVASRGELRVEKLQERKTWQVVLIGIGTLDRAFV